jgi:isocitrate dehydrogenase
VLTAALMLEHLGERDGADVIRRGVEAALQSGKVTIVKGRAAEGTKAAGEAIATTIRNLK